VIEERTEREKLGHTGCAGGVLAGTAQDKGQRVGFCVNTNGHVR